MAVAETSQGMQDLPQLAVSLSETQLPLQS
jgi:hypothetical protein